MHTTERLNKEVSVRAEETLPNRREFELDAEQWLAFQAALEPPQRVMPRLKKLLQQRSRFERITIVFAHLRRNDWETRRGIACALYSVQAFLNQKAAVLF